MVLASFDASLKHEKGLSHSNYSCRQIDLKHLNKVFQGAALSNNYDPIERSIKLIFNDVVILNSSFYLKKSNLEIDFPAVQKFYGLICLQPPFILKTFMTCIDRLLAGYKEMMENIKCVRDCRYLLIFLLNPILERKKSSKELNFHHSVLCKLLRIIAFVSNKFSFFFINSFIKMSSDLAQNLVENLNYFISFRIMKVKTMKRFYSDQFLISAVKTLSLICTANNLSPKISTYQFYNTSIDIYVKILQDYVRWYENVLEFSFCQYPFLISIGTKVKILLADAKSQMNLRVISFLKSVYYGNNNVVSPYLNLQIRRSFLIEDSFAQICLHKKDLKKKLVIQFIGEEGIDSGGLAKEWFLLLITELFWKTNDLFEYEEETKCFWFTFNNYSTEEIKLQRYFLIGVIIGLAIYNCIILSFSFPLVFYKKLLGYPLSIHDLKTLRPSLAKSLESLLSYNSGDFEEVFSRTFSVTIESNSIKKEIELIPNGRNINVNMKNRRFFVTKYIDFILNTSFTKEFRQIKEGFDLICSKNALSLFKPDELEIVLCGTVEISINDLKSITEYHECSPDEPLIIWYWEILEGLSYNSLAKYISFLTGINRISALENMKIKIQCIGEDCERLPVAHTCFNQLSLYRYSSYSKLETKLWTAFNESEGFELK